MSNAYSVNKITHCAAKNQAKSQYSQPITYKGTFTMKKESIKQKGSHTYRSDDSQDERLPLKQAKGSSCIMDMGHTEEPHLK